MRPTNGPTSASFCFSLDTELGWGVKDDPNFADYRRRFDDARDVVDQLCLLLDRYSIPTTWAFVAHLMLSSKETRPPLSELELARPDNVDRGGWFRDQPCGGVTEAPDWFGADIVERVMMARTGHEIACHSFSHKAFDPESTPREEIVNELRAAKAAAHDYGITFKSFVFPYNIEGYHQVLKNAGYTCYRGHTRQWFDRYPKECTRAARFFDQLLGLPPALGQCELHPSGLVNVPATMFLMPPSKRGARKLLSDGARRRKLEASLRTACEEGALLHLWAHPHNFFAEPHAMLDTLEIFFELLSHERSTGRIETLTMQDTAARFTESRRPHVTAQA